MGETRKRWSASEIMTILKRHLVEKVDLSKVCEEFGCIPSQVYKWERTFFTEGAIVFEQKPGIGAKELDVAREKIAELEKRLQKKHEVLSELMEEHVSLKKTLGDA